MKSSIFYYFDKLFLFIKNGDAFKRLIKNSGKLVGGESIASLISLVTMAISARVLGPEKFGVLILVQVYVSIVDKIVNFQSWQAIIKFASDAVVENDMESLKGLIKFGFILDISTSILGGLIAISGAIFVGELFNWSDQVITLSMVYGGVIFFHINGTPTAILRFYDKFGLFAYHRIFVASFKFINVLIAYLLSYDLTGFIIVWMSAEFFSYILLVGFGFIELKYQEIIDFNKVNISGIFKKFPGLWSYVWTTNLHGTIRMASKELDTVIVGIILGNKEVGFLKIAKQFSSILNKVSQPLYTAIYPELTKLWANNKIKEFIKVITVSVGLASILGFIIWGVFIFFSEFLITMIFGNEYVEAQILVIWYMLGVCISMASFSFTPAILAMGYPKLSLIHI